MMGSTSQSYSVLSTADRHLVQPEPATALVPAQRVRGLQRPMCKGPQASSDDLLQLANSPACWRRRHRKLGLVTHATTAEDKEGCMVSRCIHHAVSCACQHGLKRSRKLNVATAFCLAV
eukprot:196690-Amphidinium_carterae.1